MSSLTSNDINLKRPSSRVLKPSGGGSTFSLEWSEDTVEKLPPPPAYTVSGITNIGDNNDKSRGISRQNVPKNTFSFSQATSLQSVKETNNSNNNNDVVETTPEKELTGKNSSPIVSYKNNHILGNTYKKSGINVGIIVMDNTHKTIICDSINQTLLKMNNKVTGILRTVTDIFTITHASQQLLEECDALLVAAVISNDSLGNSTGSISQSVLTSLFQLNLLTKKPVYPGILVAKDELEARACIKLTTAGWVQSLFDILPISVSVVEDPSDTVSNPTPTKSVIGNILSDSIIANNNNDYNNNNGKIISNKDVYDVDELLKEFRSSLKMHGCFGIFGISRKFRIIDDDGNKKIDWNEFQKMISEHNVEWKPSQSKLVFNWFDSDHAGSINFEEFLQGVRGPLVETRKQLVMAAFDILDLDKSGTVELKEIKRKYNASCHPEVISGKISEDEVLSAFMQTFNGGKSDGKITPQEFIDYYTNLSASIDDDDYFELMIRNAWHMSGGSEWAANTSCKRVLVRHDGGHQTVEELKNDLGMKYEVDSIVAKLKSQGIDDITGIDMGDGTIIDVELPSSLPSSSSSSSSSSSAISSTPKKETTSTLFDSSVSNNSASLDKTPIAKLRRSMDNQNSLNVTSPSGTSESMGFRRKSSGQKIDQNKSTFNVFG